MVNGERKPLSMEYLAILHHFAAVKSWSMTSHVQNRAEGCRRKDSVFL